MNEFRADLHVHSHHSDGTDSAQKLIELAKKIGLSALSITDHDTIDAYTALGSGQDFPVLAGVEFSCFYKQESVHVLGYGFSLDSQNILTFCKKHQERRRERNQRMIYKLQKLGFQITTDELYANSQGTIGRPHIAYLLLKKGIIRSIQEGFQKYLGEGKPAYDAGQRIEVEETIEVIKKGEGKAILAHPHLLQKKSTVRAVLEMPFDGLEGYYARIPPEQEAVWVNAAQKRGWIVTGGSDYHGATKPTIPLGCSWTNQDTFKLLYGNKHT